MKKSIVVSTENTVALVQSLADMTPLTTVANSFISPSLPRSLQLAHAEFHVARFVPLRLILDKLVHVYVLLKFESHWQLIQIFESFCIFARNDEYASDLSPAPSAFKGHFSASGVCC